MAMTSVSEVNTRSICDGMRLKHSAPSAISAQPKYTDTDSVLRQRSMLRAA